jgi:hypothetical protein
MKRILVIFSVGLSSLVMLPYCLIASSSEPYTDDAYYWPEVDTISPTEPVYDRSAREFIFLDDTIQSPDTVRMRILDR